jgi:hypothetical protein
VVFSFVILGYISLAPRRELYNRRNAGLESQDDAQGCHVVQHVVSEQESGELALVVRSWPSLSQPLRAAVLAIIRTGTGRCDA